MRVDLRRPGVEGVEVVREAVGATAVADVAGVAVLGRGRVVVAGVGIEVWRVEVGGLEGGWMEG